jgi:hypothetical protein
MPVVLSWSRCAQASSSATLPVRRRAPAREEPPDAGIPAISALVLVLLTADGPILVRAALRTRHGGAIEAFDFSGAMAQRAGIGWYGHVCSFSSVDAGKPRAAAPSSPGEIPPARAWTPRVQPFRKLDRRSRFGIISNLFKHGNVVERRREGPSPSASPSRRRLGSHPLPDDGC